VSLSAATKSAETAASTESAALVGACSHCGREIAPAVAPAFCCSGCETVYAALGSCGLGGFYAMRDEFGARATAAATGFDYGWLDTEEVLATHGFTPGSVALRLTGLHCAACVWLLERLPQAVPGTLRARVDFGAQVLHLQWDPARVSLSSIASFVHGLGYPVQLGAAEADRAAKLARRRTIWRLAVTGALAGNTMLAAFALYAGELSSMDDGFRRMFEILGLLFAIPAVTWGAWPFYTGAIAGLRMRVLHMDLPISLGIIAGFVASAWATIAGNGALYFDTVTMLVFLLLVGRHLQSWGQARVRTRSELMTALVPPLAERDDDGVWTKVPSDRVAPGDRIRVLAGGKFTADGEVLVGNSHADLSILTGESRPEAIGPGSQIFAGATNLSEAIELRVSRAGGASRVGQIVARLCAEDDRPAPIVRTADRLAGWFVAAVLVLAAAGGLWWWPRSPSTAFDVVISLLVVSCPCALGLATPMALTVARARAARAGLMLRSGAALESLARVKHLLVDKTGTLTEGRLEVVASSVDRAVEPLVVALERHSRHPIARALAAWAATTAELGLVRDVEERAGQALQGTVAGHRVRIGSAQWLGAADRDDVRHALARARTPVVVEVDGVVRGVLAVSDRVRPEAAAVLGRLRALGKSIEICSGDHPAVVAAVADELGVTGRGGCTPEDKAARVAEWAPAAMIGDGINDALAMRRATVGIAVRGGAEAALSVAEVYLGRDDLDGIAELFEGARRTQHVVLRNLGFSLIYNAVFAGLALAGLITPLVAAILMPISSLTVIGSSFASRTFGPPRRAHDVRRDAQRFPLSTDVPDAMQALAATSRG
jgi:Cu2+-exporting ATPase